MMDTKNYNNEEIAQRIELLRKQRNLSVNKLATMSGVDTGNLSRSIKGKASFSDRVIYKIAHALNVSLDWLEKGIEPMFSPTVASTNEIGAGITGSNVNGSYSPNVSQSLGTSDAALQAENEMLKKMVADKDKLIETQQKHIDALLAIVGQK